MKILLIGSYAPSLVNFRAPLIKDLVSNGHEVHVSCPDVSREVQRKINDLGATVHDIAMSRTGLNPIKDVLYLYSLNRLIRKHGIQFLISYTIKPNIWGALAAWPNGVPSAALITGLGYTFAGNKSLKHSLVKGAASLLLSFATSRNRFLVFQNPDDRDEYLNAGYVRDKDKIRMMNGSGVDLNHYAKSPLPKEPVFLMISRLLVSKGVREYCEAAVRVKREFPKARFLLAGYLDKGPDSIRATELDRWLEDGIEYLGFQKDVRPVIAESNVYVLPSYREGTPRSVLEAMAMGRPIITTDAPGCRETTVDGESGFLIPTKDTDSVAQAMRRFIENPNLKNRMGEASYKRVLDKYDVELVNKKLIDDLALKQL